MDNATLIGVLSGTILIGVAILLGGDFSLFLDFPAFLITVGGTFATLFVRYPMVDVLSTLTVVKQAFFVKLQDQGEVIAQFVNLSQLARREGLLALERLPVDDPFLSRGIRYCVDGHDPKQIEAILMKEIQYTRARHEAGQNILRAMANAAPAFGMIGTLIGLVQMLSSMDDPRAIGPGMAVALLATLYGAVIANLFALPLADKLAVRSSEEIDLKLLMLEGVLGLKRGENPRLLEETLHTFLPPKARDAVRTAT